MCINIIIVFISMSQFPKLNIDIRDLTRPPKKLKFVIKPDPEPPPKKPTVPSMPAVPRIQYIFLFLILVCMFISFSFYRPSRGLRKIIRMTCTVSGTMQICSAYGKGEYVVDVRGCDSFEFNGIPFTELMKHKGHYRLPSDTALHIIDPCPTIVATIDSHTLSKNTNYAMKGNLYSSKAIWISDNCYKDFTLRIGTETLLQNTPISMIESLPLKNKTAYMYESTGVSGPVMVTGRGCSTPIHIYAK